MRMDLIAGRRDLVLLVDIFVRRQVLLVHQGSLFLVTGNLNHTHSLAARATQENGLLLSMDESREAESKAVETHSKAING